MLRRLYWERVLNRAIRTPSAHWLEAGWLNFRTLFQQDLEFYRGFADHPGSKRWPAITLNEHFTSDDIFTYWTHLNLVDLCIYKEPKHNAWSKDFTGDDLFLTLNQISSLCTWECNRNGWSSWYPLHILACTAISGTLNCFIDQEPLHPGLLLERIRQIDLGLLKYHQFEPRHRDLYTRIDEGLTYSDYTSRYWSGDLQ